MSRQAVLFAISVVSFHLLTPSSHLLLNFGDEAFTTSNPYPLSSPPLLPFSANMKQRKMIGKFQREQDTCQELPEQVQLPPNYQEFNNSSRLPQPDRDFFLSTLAGDNDNPSCTTCDSPSKGWTIYILGKHFCFSETMSNHLAQMKEHGNTSSMEALSGPPPFPLHKFGV